MSAAGLAQQRCQPASCSAACSTSSSLPSAWLPRRPAVRVPAAGMAAAGAQRLLLPSRSRGHHVCRVAGGASLPSDDSRRPTNSGEDWDYGSGAAGSAARGRRGPDYKNTDWGWTGAEDWDPASGLDREQMAALRDEYEQDYERSRFEGRKTNTPRDKWITPLLDFQSIAGAFDPDQKRTEDFMREESLTNKVESREGLSFLGRLIAIPLLTGAVIGKALTEPVLNFTLQNNPDAFALSEEQKLEAAKHIHIEESRLRMDMAIGRAPVLNDDEMLQHLREFAHEVNEEEREVNEHGLMTMVSDSISLMVALAMLSRDREGRTALVNTWNRLFEGLSDVAKAVLIILVTDTMLGYHSEEGWTGLIDVALHHYGLEGDEEFIVVFVGIIPVAIDVVFKYWIFTALNGISPGAVVTIKQIDRH